MNTVLAIAVLSVSLASASTSAQERADAHHRASGPDDPRMATVPAAVREQWAQADFRRQQMTEEMLNAAPRAIAQDWRTVKIMHEAGVTILAGTDAAFLNPCLFHGATLKEDER